MLLAAAAAAGCSPAYQCHVHLWQQQPGLPVSCLYAWMDEWIVCFELYNIHTWELSFCGLSESVTSPLQRIEVATEAQGLHIAEPVVA